MATKENLRVLHLVTAREVFFDQQIDTLEKKGVDCTVCVVPGAEQIDGNMGERRGSVQYLQYFSRVRKALHRGEYDLIHANYGLTAPYAVTQFRLPVILTLWGSDVVGFDGLVTKSCAWWCDAVTVRSEEMRKLLGREDAHIVPSGVDLETFRPLDRYEARNQIGWDRNKMQILFPYSPEYERKNYPLAKRVVDRARGQTEEEIELRTISGVEHDEVPVYMNAADAVLLTSKHEGSPNTVKEAMACNIPVVSTDVGDVRTRLANVSNSYVSTTENELADALSMVLKTDRRSNGREAVRSVSWDRIGDQLVRIYQTIS